MLSRLSLLGATAVIGALMLPASASASTTPCTVARQSAGLCKLDVANTGNFVEAGATDRTEGRARTDERMPISDAGSDDYVYIPVFEEQTFMEKVCLSWTSYDECLREVFPDATPEEIEEFEAIPAITITDLARFAPAGTPLSGEPDNLGVAGLPTNFVASASVQTQNGDLFGFPIRVRFTPATYSFHYGDGATDSGSEGGTSWASLGQAQFTPTDTSHTYAERGTYDARVDVAYTAEIDLGGGWFSVAGQLSTTGPAQEIRIFEAHTALVANTCAERPSAPGC